MGDAQWTSEEATLNFDVKWRCFLDLRAVRLANPETIAIADERSLLELDSDNV